METSDRLLSKALCKTHQVLTGKILLEPVTPTNRAGEVWQGGGYRMEVGWAGLFSFSGIWG